MGRDADLFAGANKREIQPDATVSVGEEEDEKNTRVEQSSTYSARLEKSALFNPAYYLTENPDVAAAGVDPLAHYIMFGASEGRDPHPLFDGSWYLENSPDVAAAGVNPLEHYLSADVSEGRNPNPFFDGSWYLSKYPDVLNSGLTPLEHYVSLGARQGRDPNPMFDAAWYLRQNPDVAAAGVNPFEHYVRHGANEGRNPHPLFDAAWYLAKNPDVAAAGLNPMAHFLAWGGREAREVHPIFDWKWYRRRYPNVAASGMHPLQHYLTSGGFEGFDPIPLFDSRWYLEQNPDVLKAGVNPLVDYLHQSGEWRKSPHPLFDADWYLRQYPDVAAAGVDPLIHFISNGAAEGRNPNPWFDTRWYISRFPELEEYANNALMHYLDMGAAAGRDPGPNFKTYWYVQSNPEVAKSGLNPLTHYVLFGRDQGLAPTPPGHKVDPPIVASHPIAVVFLARSDSDSTASFEPFAKSYRTFPAGVAHDLIVIRKGHARSPAARLALDAMFAGADAQYIDLSDRGYDIQAYLRAAEILPHEYVCFFNTHSEILRDDWLAKLFAPLSDPGVGMTGASASYESVTSSTELTQQAIWLAARARIPFNAEYASLLRDHFDVHAPDWMRTADREPSVPIPYGAALERLWAREWSHLTRAGGELRPLGAFKPFPNPHMRTNAFLMRRQLLLDLGFRLDNSKMACAYFESGPDGLSERLAKSGLRKILVGADGSAYELTDWAASNTFRLGDQENLMVSDNRVLEYARLRPEERRRSTYMTWGDACGDTPAIFEQLNFRFSTAGLRPGARVGLVEPGPALEKPAMPDFSGAPVVLAGYSHMYALVGLDEPVAGFSAASRFRVDDIDGSSGLRVCNGEWPRTEEYWNSLCAMAESAEAFSLAISFRGNDHLARFLISPATPFDFVAPELPDLPVDPDAQIVPDALIEALFSPDYEAFRPIVRRLAASGRRIILIGTPPPKSSDVFLRAAILHEAAFLSRCKEMGVAPAAVKFTALNVRLKLWRVLQRLCEKIAIEEGAEFLPVPAAALDANGALLEEYWSPDCTHANRKYGELALRDIRRYLNEREA